MIKKISTRTEMIRKKETKLKIEIIIRYPLFSFLNSYMCIFFIIQMNLQTINSVAKV